MKATTEEVQRAGDAELLVRIKNRVLASITHQAPARTHHTVRAGAGCWETLAPGLERKLLWEAGDAQSCLVRLAPGTALPPHGHPIDEECVVLEGSLRVGTCLLLRVGDFHVGIRGVEHEAVSTDDGCVCFQRTARHFFKPLRAGGLIATAP